MAVGSINVTQNKVLRGCCEHVNIPLGVTEVMKYID
jgi:hypothetical protein